MTQKQYNQIKELIENIFSKNGNIKLLNNHFKNEITTYQIMIKELNNKENITIYFDNMDIILKLVGFKLYNTINTSLIKTILEFLESLYLVLNEYNYKLNDIEYNIIILVLIEKLNIYNNYLKEKILTLLSKYIFLIGPENIIKSLFNINIDEKNKIKTYILEIIINLYESYHFNICSQNFINLLNKFLLSTEDKNVKGKCIVLFKKIFSVLGNKLWNFMKCNEKTKQLIEDTKNDIYCINDNKLYVKHHRNKSYIENQNFRVFNTQKNQTNNNTNNDIFYNTCFNFNINDKKENIFENYNNNYNKINIKKISKIKKKFLQNLITKPEYKSLNNSFYMNENNNYENDSDNDNDNYDYIFKLKNKILSKEELKDKMNNLLSENYSIKINSIIILHEMLVLKYEENKYLILNNIEQIMDIFIKIIKELFSNINKNIENNLNFMKYTKYIVTTLCKILSNKELIMHISYKTIYSLSEIIINCLLINEDMIEDNGNNEEKNIIFKSLNSSMMRILDNYNITSIILILFELISNYYNKNMKNNDLFIVTILKCLEKKTQNIENIIPIIEVSAILLQIHLLLNKLNQSSNEFNSKNEIYLTIIGFIKQFIKEIILFKKEQILEDYNSSVKNHFIPDNYIIKWINEFLSYK